MLVLTRKLNESISVKLHDERWVTITVVRIDGKQVRISVDAPLDVKVAREELFSQFGDLSPADDSPALKASKIGRLVITRRVMEVVRIQPLGEPALRVDLLRVRGCRASLGLDAPPGLLILRTEVLERERAAEAEVESR